MTRETSRDYARPYRPPVVRLANVALAPLARRPGRLEVQSLLGAAAKRAGGADFGDEAFLEPLTRLCDSLEREARLNPVGRLIMRERMVATLTNRALTEDALRRHPEARSPTLRRPLIVVGLQRTGTTFLHRLLAADPRRRALASWEALQPVPLRRGAPLRQDPWRRRRSARISERALAAMAPDFFAVHPIAADEPEEDVVLLEQSFRSTVPEATLRVPSYARWLEGADQRPAYLGLARLLALLSLQRGSDRWVLKTPHHLEHLETLLEVFPDAAVIWTHREPEVCVASFLSMLGHARGVFSDRVDPLEIGREWVRKLVYMLERALGSRERHPETTFVDVPYTRLVADPGATALEILEAVGERADGDVERAIRAAIDRHPQHKHGRHVYDARDFGFEPGELAARFDAYRSRFAGVLEPSLT